MTNIVTFDLETTGLYPIRNKIVEIGAVRFDPDNGTVIDKFQTLVNPAMSIPQEVIEIHGITDEMTKNAPYEKDALLMFLGFIGDNPLIAHNISFDVGFIMAGVSSYKIKVPSNLLIDSCEFSRIHIKNVENYKLSTLGRSLNLEQNGYHRALADAMVVMKLYRMCIEKASAGKNKTDIEYIAYQTTNGLRFSDYVFDKVAIPEDKMEIKRAIEESRSVEIRYRSGKGEESLRVITPFNIYSFLGKTYVQAHCHNTDEPRQFRLDRVCEVITR
ncbi:MAG: exonuclease domain-containing protein [Planctomycetota bacterium]|nr:exonuclease domain-containing protein [Planctomycetota bacterium]MDI6787744.1 exonuclease domain-containing protein [Planctomycetota bacterium]